MIESIADDFLNKPSPEDLARRTAAARAEAGNHAVPASAGGSFALADRLIAAACARLGRSEPRGDKRKSARLFFAKALKAEGLSQGDPAALERAVRDWLDPEGDYAFFLPQYEFSPKHELALRHFGIVLSRAKKSAEEAEARRARALARNEEALAAFEARKAARPSAQGDPAWEHAKRELVLQMTKATFDTRVKDTYGSGQEDGVYTVVAPNALAKDWLDNRLKTTAQRTLVGILGEQVEVRFEISDGTG